MIAVGASAGGLDPLRLLVAGLSPRLPASVLIVRHLAADGPGLLAGLLASETDLPTADAIDGEPLRPGRILVAPADRHLIIDGDRVRLSRDPRENRFRPGVDPLFRSAAVHRGMRAIGVVLSGQLDDGTAGLIAIRRAGGTAVAQSPDDAAAPSMPSSAIEHAGVDHQAPARELGPLLTRLVTATDFGGERPRPG